jgi:hypothetical protein
VWTFKYRPMFRLDIRDPSSRPEDQQRQFRLLIEMES